MANEYPEWMRKAASKGGKATSGAKAKAARRNGKKGGRPRKQSVAERKKVVVVGAKRSCPERKKYNPKLSDGSMPPLVNPTRKP